MSMGKIIPLILTVVAGVILSMIFLTAVMPIINSLINIAYTDPSAGNYSEYKNALGAAPLRIYGVPLIISGLAIVYVLRLPEGR